METDTVDRVDDQSRRIEKQGRWATVKSRKIGRRGRLADEVDQRMGYIKGRGMS